MFVLLFKADVNGVPFAKYLPNPTGVRLTGAGGCSATDGTSEIAAKRVGCRESEGVCDWNQESRPGCKKKKTKAFPQKTRQG